MMQKKLMVALVLATLPACAGPKITAEDVVIARYQAESQQACYRAQAAQAQQYPDARDAALVIMAQALAGRGSNSCGVTNVYDARAAIDHRPRPSWAGIRANQLTRGPERAATRRIVDQICEAATLSINAVEAWG